MKRLLLFAFSIVLFTSCYKNDKLVLKQSSGKINSLVIVVDNSQWQGEAGNKLRDIIAAPVLGLPQEENQFSVTHAPIKAFEGIFKTSRNVLLVGYDKADIFSVKKDIYASPQVVMTILGKDEASLLAMLEKHKEAIISVFKEADLKVYQQKLAKSVWNIDSLKTLKNLGVKLNIPKDYRLVTDTGDFLWLRSRIPKGSMNIIAYQLPLKNEEDIVNSITAERDTIGKKYIPGSTEGMYMITEVAYSPHILKTELNGKSAFETRGTWEMKNDFMAGPFLNYTIVDKKNNRLLVFEGFTFAPSVDKRDFMFELESILKTIKI